MTRRAQQEEERGEEEEQLCLSTLAVQTPESDDDNIPAYHGVIFDVAALSELHITALEFDARLDEVTDFTVEVFVGEGGDLILADESQWTRVAQVEATITPSGRGLLIPQQAFEPIQFQRNERRSLYISMNGPWVESTVNALEITGEPQVRENDLALYVGLGVNGRFPSERETTTDPKFSGRIFYQKEVVCGTSSASTELDLTFLIAGSEDPVFVSQVSKELDNIVRNDMLQSPPFSTWVQTMDLVVSQSPQVSRYTYDRGGCPEDWEVCPRNVLGPRFFFEHDDELSSGTLEFEIYQYADTLGKLIGERVNTEDVLYVGLVPVVSEYTLSLGGISGNFADRHLRFLELASTNYFADAVLNRDPSVQVLDTKIDSYDAQGGTNVRRNIRALQEDVPIQFEGSVRGVQPVFLPITNFPFLLRDSVADNGEALKNSIQASATVAPNGEVFESVRTAEAVFDPDLVFSDNSRGEKVSTGTIIAIVVVGVVVLLLVGMVRVFWHQLENWKNERLSKRRKAKIEDMKQEKEKRAEKREKIKEERASIPIEISLEKMEEAPKASRPQGVRRVKSNDELIEKKPASRTRETLRRAHSSDDVIDRVTPNRRPTGANSSGRNLGGDQHISQNLQNSRRALNNVSSSDLHSSQNLQNSRHDLNNTSSGDLHTSQSLRRDLKQMFSGDLHTSQNLHGSRSDSKRISISQPTTSGRKSRVGTTPPVIPPRRKVERAQSSDGAGLPHVDAPAQKVRRAKSFESVVAPPTRRGGRREPPSGNDGQGARSQRPLNRTSSRGDMQPSQTKAPLRVKSFKSRGSTGTARPSNPPKSFQTRPRAASHDR